MARRPRLAFAILSALAGSCHVETSQSHLTRDYVLTTNDPAAQNHTDVLLRYEDDWLPGTCVGETQLYDPARLRIEWACAYDTDAGPTPAAPAVGVLRDDDGDGTFDGPLLLYVLPDVSSRSLSPTPRLVQFTATPLPPR